MATTKGSAIASPQIFGSDPIEQIHAKGLTDPDMGGLSYAFMNAARGSRADAQATYLDALRESNMMASQLARHEADQDLLKEMLKSQAELANAGVDVSTFNPALTGKLYSNVNDPRVTQPSFLSRDLKAANALKARADAAHAASGGDSGGVKITNTQDYGSSGVVGDTRVVITGKDQAAVDRAVAADKARRAAGGGSGAPPPSTTVMTPSGTVQNKTTAQLREEARNAQLITQRLNEKDAKYRNQ